MIKLPDSICAPEELTALILEIREYAKWYGHEVVKRRSGSGRQSTPPVVSTTAANLLRQQASSGALQPDQLEKIIDELEAHKRNAPSITLTLAAPAP